MGPHDHDHLHVDPRRARVLGIAVVACAVATVVGLVLLWPRGDSSNVLDAGDPLPVVDATVREVIQQPCAGTDPAADLSCLLVRAEVMSGTPLGVTAEIELADETQTVRLSPGDDIRLSYDATDAGGLVFYFFDYERSTPLVLLAALFAAAVIGLGGLRGIGALSGLIVSLVTLTIFTLPALLDGQAPVPVAIVTASAIGLLALYLAHGVKATTAVAVLGTFVSLLLTAVLAQVFVGAAHLSGFTDEESFFLDATTGTFDLRGILLASIVIGSLGVLDDVTVTQVAVVGELSRVQPGTDGRQLFGRALRIGRDHISSTVNTLVLAYAGASLPLLLLLTQAERALADVVTSEVVATEVVRALVGSIGLVASVPITTALAVWVLRPQVGGGASTPTGTGISDRSSTSARARPGG